MNVWKRKKTQFCISTSCYKSFWILIWLRPTGSARYFHPGGFKTYSSAQGQTFNNDTEHTAAYITYVWAGASKAWQSVQIVNACMTQHLCVFSFSTTFRRRGLFPNPGLCSTLQRWPWHWATSTLWTSSTGIHTQTGSPCKVTIPICLRLSLAHFLARLWFKHDAHWVMHGNGSRALILMTGLCRENVLPKSCHGLWRSLKAQCVTL